MTDFSTVAYRPPNTDSVERAIALILEELGEATTPVQERALEAFKSEDYANIKRMSLSMPGEHFLKALGYLGSARKLTPNTDTILVESLRAAADYRREQIAAELGLKISEVLNG